MPIQLILIFLSKFHCKSLWSFLSPKFGVNLAVNLAAIKKLLVWIVLKPIYRSNVFYKPSVFASAIHNENEFIGLALLGSTVLSCLLLIGWLGF